MAKNSYQENQVTTNLIAEMPVVKDSTVSKVPVNNQILQVTVFSFSAGQSLSTHASPKAVVLTLLSGEMDFTLQETDYHLTAGDTMYMAPGAPHSLTAVTDCHLHLTMVDARPWKDK